MQLEERIFVGKNRQMELLSRKQTPVYNQSMHILRSGYFWWKYLEPGWRTYYTFKGSLHLSFHDLRDIMRWLLIYRDTIPTCAMNTIQRVHKAWRAWETSTIKFNACKAQEHAKLFLKGETHEPCPACGYTGKPCIPRYARKGQRSAIYFTYTQFSIKNHRTFFLRKSGIKPIHVLRLNNQVISDSRTSVKQGRIIPAENEGFWVEFIHNVDIVKNEVNEQNIMDIDLEMNDLATAVNNLGDQPICFNRKCRGWAKEINQWYSNEMA